MVLLSEVMMSMRAHLCQRVNQLLLNHQLLHIEDQLRKVLRWETLHFIRVGVKITLRQSRLLWELNISGNLMKIHLLADMNQILVKLTGNPNLQLSRKKPLLIEDLKKENQSQGSITLLLISLGLMSILRIKKLPWEVNINGSLIQTHRQEVMILTKVKPTGNQNLLSLSQTLLHIEDQRKVIQNQDNTMQLFTNHGLMKS